MTRTPLRSASPAPLCVLVVDADPQVRRAVARALLARGVDVLTAEDGPTALALLETRPVDAALVDPALAVELARHSERVVVVVMAPLGATPDPDLDAFAHIYKPLTPEALLIVVRAGEHRRLRDALGDATAQMSQSSELIGGSTRMRELRRLVRSAARSTAPVLVVGESGAGKSRVARAIHAASPRRGGPFVSVDVGALPRDLVMDELFGVATGEGLVAQAHRGTLHVEELGALPEPAQRRLLHLLVHHEALRGDSSEPVDVRLIAECSREAKELVARGELREDLAVRLGVFVVRVPPLRQRQDDLALLAYHFAEQHATRSGRAFTRIGVETLRSLRARPWPGNVRELEATMEHAVALAHGGPILPADLPGRVDPAEAIGAEAPPFEPELAELAYALAKDRITTRFDAFYVRELMRRTGENVSEAARRAAMDRSNFRRLLKKARDRSK